MSAVVLSLLGHGRRTERKERGTDVLHRTFRTKHALNDAQD